MMKTNCLACGGNLGNTLFYIPDLPLVDSFSRTAEEAREVQRCDVDLRQCQKCSTIQISSPPDTREIYKNYIYESASSPDLSEHFRKYAKYVKSLTGNENTNILEIGANDGLLLEQLSYCGFKRLVGVDPSPQSANINIAGVEIVNDFFCAPSISHLGAEKFGIIIANNCFSHIPGLQNVLELCSKILKKTGTMMVEVQSTLDLIEGVVFDYIYHEHYFYHTAQSIEKVAKLSGLELYHIEHVDTKGGSYRFLLGHKGAHIVTSTVDYWKFREDLVGVNNFRSWGLMTKYLSGIKTRLGSIIDQNPRPLIGYGASATGTVLLRYMGIEKGVSTIVDDNPKRQGLYSPGDAIPVRAPSTLESNNKCLILAWRHSKHIIPKLKSKGVEFIVPLPSIQLSE